MEEPTIGHNNPPEAPFEIYQEKITDLYDEAVNWLDGKPIETEEMAEGVTSLLQLLRKAGKEADDERTKEKAPHLEAGRNVDAKWKPLGELVNRATTAAKQALQPYLKKKAAEKEEADRKLREEADRKRREAEEAFRNSQADDLLAREAAEEKLKEAKIADKTANREARKGAGVAGSFGKAVSLRSSYKAILHDPEEALEFFWPSVEIEECLTAMAQRMVKNGKREIPGFEIRKQEETF